MASGDYYNQGHQPAPQHNQGGYPSQQPYGGYPPPLPQYGAPSPAYGSPAPGYSGGYAPPVSHLLLADSFSTDTWPYKAPQQYEQPRPGGYYDQGSHHNSSYGHHAQPAGPGAYADADRGHGPPGSEGPDGGKERGLGATLVGASGGGFLGHELGGGALGTIGGAIAGAIGANMLEKRHHK